MANKVIYDVDDSFQARRHGYRGHWDAASVTANDVLRSDPNSPDVLALRGLILFLSAETTQALLHARSRTSTDITQTSQGVDRLKEEGYVAFKAGRLDEATERYTEALERIGENEDEGKGKGGHIRPMLLSNRAMTLVKMAQGCTSRHGSFQCSQPQLFRNPPQTARIHLHLKKYDDAVADFKQAIDQAERDGREGGADVRALKTELKRAEVALKGRDYCKIHQTDEDGKTQVNPVSGG